ncbi:FAD-dependent oxidoreductase [Legionella sp. CNM-1927-20]|uniref:FAD-dependent oxidoreductase n=1 Tax=Legionella sp. CNM-1927-20 TaxID=3422221 RepID=UPI00403ADBBA
MQGKDDRFDVIVIGAGIAGVTTALELAKIEDQGKKLRIALIEAGSEVLPATCSTQNECNKLHTGMHYLADLETAKKCLESAIEFAKKYPTFIAGREFTPNPCLGRHYILDKSTVSPEQAREVAEYLKKLYAEKVAEDPSNKVFGEPEEFIQELSREQYDFISDSIPFRDDKGNIVGTTAVAMAFQTAEAQVNIPKLQKHLQQQVLDTENITFIPNTYVTNIGLTSDHFGYYICTKSTELDRGIVPPLEANAIVNCSWQNAAVLDKGVESHFDKTDSNNSKGVNRVKVSIEIELPQELQHLNTSLFSTGPFFSFTNLGNGKAILTSERLTNIDFYPDGMEMPADIKENIEKLRSTPMSDMAKGLAESIIDDCADCLKDKYRALLLQTKSKEIKIHVGIVNIPGLKKEYTKKDIYSQDSVIHSRKSDGIVHKSLGYISHLSAKMTYAGRNPEKVKSMIDKDLELIENYEALVNLIVPQLKLTDAYATQDVAGIEQLLYVEFRQQMLEIIYSEDINPKTLTTLEGTCDGSLRSKVENLITEILQSKKNNGEIYQSKPRNAFFSPPANALTGTAARRRDNTDQTLRKDMLTTTNTKPGSNGPNTDTLKLNL